MRSIARSTRRYARAAPPTSGVHPQTERLTTETAGRVGGYLVDEEAVTDISHQRLRLLLREEGVSFQALRTPKRSHGPEFEAKKNRILELHAIADGIAEPGPDDPKVGICVDEFGPLNLQPQPGGKAWAPRAKPRRIRATYTHPHGVRHLLRTFDVADAVLTGEVAEHKTRVEFLHICDQVHARYPADVRCESAAGMRASTDGRRNGLRDDPTVRRPTGTLCVVRHAPVGVRSVRAPAASRRRRPAARQPVRA